MMSSQDVIDSRQIADRGGNILNVVNHPLPWVCLFALIVMALIWMVSDARSDARIADIKAESANQRISDLISANAQIQVAYQQTINDIRNRSIDAETQFLLLRSHADELRLVMVKAGLKIPPIPKELNTPR